MQSKPKSIKTRKAVAKRFKITGSGKIVRSRPGKRHLLASKNAKRRRKLGTSALVDKTDYSRVLENLPFSHWLQFYILDKWEPQTQPHPANVANAH